MHKGAEFSAGFEVSSPWRQKILGLCRILVLLMLELGCAGLIYYLITYKIVNASVNYDIPGLLFIMLIFALILTLPFLMAFFADRMVMLARYHIGRAITVDGGELKFKGKTWSLRRIVNILKSSSSGRVKYRAYDKFGTPVCYWLNNYGNAEKLLNWLKQGGCGAAEDDSKMFPNLRPQRNFSVYTYEDEAGKTVSCFAVCSPWPRRCAALVGIVVCLASALGTLYGCYDFLRPIWPIDVIKLLLLPSILWLLPLFVEYAKTLYKYDVGRLITIEGDRLTVGDCSWDMLSLTKYVFTPFGHSTYGFTVYDKSGKPIAYVHSDYHNADRLRQWLKDGGCEEIQPAPKGCLRKLLAGS